VLANQSIRYQNELKGRRTNWILAQLNQHMHLYGYELIDLPVIDVADLFLVRAGDQIINSLFTFDRQGKQLALRPEFTASAADYFIRTEGSPIVRWQFSGPVFEDKSHEFSAHFEQLGIGAELIGLAGSLAEAEIIAMSAGGLEKLGVQNTLITIGHIGLIREILKQFNLDIRTQRFLLHQIPAFNDPQKSLKWVLEQFDNQFSAAANNRVRFDETYTTGNFGLGLGALNSDSLLTMGGRTQEDIARRIKLKQQRLADRNNVVMAAEFLANWCQIKGEPRSTFAHLSELISKNETAVQLLEEWRNVITLLEIDGIALSKVMIKPDLSRSWEYYTGIVFELHGDGLHLGGGGRYDELARLVGSTVDIPSVGFAYYGNRLVEALETAPYEFEPIVTIISDQKYVVGATKYANQMRSHGISAQIAPYPIPNLAGNFEFIMENETTVRFRETKYQFAQIDQLINDLKHYTK